MSFSLLSFAQRKIEIDSSKYLIDKSNFLNQRKDTNREQLLQVYADRYSLNYIRKDGQLNVGHKYLFYDLSPTGHPLFISPFEARSGRVVKADLVYPLGTSGLRLTGRGMTMGVFDGGRIQFEHQEFQGRVRMIDNVEPSSGDFHATHVSGIIAAGGVNSNARGTAYESSIDGYTFDDFDTKLIEAVANGLDISNHSYGQNAGWDRDSQFQFNWRWLGDSSVSETEDWNFGFYSDWPRFHDQLIYLNPYHILVTSAGNTRSSNGPSSAPFEHEIFRNGAWVRSTKRRNINGPYDSTPSSSVAKNIVTVGAVGGSSSSAFSMANFSSWGPTDDGRIKPDLVGVGVGVFSTLENSGGQTNRYGNLQGTSMSSPNVAGGLLLIRQHFIQQHNYLPLASTIKGLAIHTANQHSSAGRGPDYRYGWGLLDVEKAASQITKLDSNSFVIEEFVLDQNENIEKYVTSDGENILKVTIAWTDPNGVSPAVSLNPKDTMLVNDIDLKVIAPDGTEFFPFILDPANPSNAATKGINYLDNIEVVEIENPMTGEYKIHISHKGLELENGFQIISLIATGSSLVSDFKNLYWIGGSGNWNDPNNWSEVSNGSPISRIPNKRDIVRFDNASFQSKDQTVIIPADAESLNFIYDTDSLANFDFTNGKLSVNGSFILTKNLTIIGEGAVEMTGEDLKFNGIASAGNDLSGINLFINSDNAYYEIEDSLTINSIFLEKGTLDLSNKYLSINQLISQGNEITSVDLRNAYIDVRSSLVFGDSTKFILTDNSTIAFGNEGAASSNFIFDTPSGSYNKLTVLNGSLSVFGQNDFNIVENSGVLTFIENTTIDSLFMEANSQLNLNDGKGLVLNYLSINSSAGNDVQITGPETGFATINVSKNIKYCFDYLSVQNVSNIGEATLNAGPNGQLIGLTEGWSALGCEEVLFAQFSYVEPCLNGVAKFTNLSSGISPISGWFIMNNQGDTIHTSNSENLEFQFERAEEFLVSLEIQENGFQKSSNKTVVIIPNPIKELFIFEDGNFLAGSIGDLEYQWILNGVPIAGATDRLYEPVDEGDYQLLATNGICSFVSPIFAVINQVVSIEDDASDSQLVLFPVPFSDFLNIRLGEIFYGNISVSLKEISGKEIFTGNYSIDAEKPEVQVSLGQIKSGVYIIEIVNDHTSVVKRLIKE